eukprot:15201549-Alexandrium_andersonii.AAC.1
MEVPPPGFAQLLEGNLRKGSIASWNGALPVALLLVPFPDMPTPPNLTPLVAPGNVLVASI